MFIRGCRCYNMLKQNLVVRLHCLLVSQFHFIYYRIAGMFGGGKFGERTQFCQTKTIQMSHAHYIAIGLCTNSPNFFAMSFIKSISPNIIPAKHSHYTVSILSNDLIYNHRVTQLERINLHTCSLYTYVHSFIHTTYI